MTVQLGETAGGWYGQGSACSNPSLRGKHHRHCLRGAEYLLKEYEWNICYKGGGLRPYLLSAPEHDAPPSDTETQGAGWALGRSRTAMDPRVPGQAVLTHVSPGRGGRSWLFPPPHRATRAGRRCRGGGGPIRRQSVSLGRAGGRQASGETAPSEEAAAQLLLGSRQRGGARKTGGARPSQG